MWRILHRLVPRPGLREGLGCREEPGTSVRGRMGSPTFPNILVAADGDKPILGSGSGCSDRAALKSFHSAHLSRIPGGSYLFQASPPARNIPKSSCAIPSLLMSPQKRCWCCTGSLAKRWGLVFPSFPFLPPCRVNPVTAKGQMNPWWSSMD